ncbi:MAG: carboxymuconolactone decarboxylase family protein [bacterium]
MSGCCAPDENLISLAVVIGVGCKPCTKFYIDKALKEGCSKEDLKRVISIAESLQWSECLRKAVSDEQADRMKEPLKIAKELLEAK